MIKNWLFYIFGLAATLTFHTFYFGWYSWFLLVLTISLPLFSLLVALPAMLRVRLSLELPASCRRGDPAYVALRLTNGFLPMPRCCFRLKIQDCMGGETQTVKQQAPGYDRWYAPLDTSHCGLLRCWTEKGRVYDYLGLFSLPVQSAAAVELLVEPVAAAPEKLPNLSQFQTRAQRPKPGGGFSEEHELRDYRPGDQLRDIHWKLSVKTDRLILREAQEPIRGLTLLTLDLCGPRARTDSALAQLLWLSKWLLDHDTPHQVCWIDPADFTLATVQVQTPEDQAALLGRLLRTTLREAVPSIAGRRFAGASWRYHILGEQEVQS